MAICFVKHLVTKLTYDKYASLCDKALSSQLIQISRFWRLYINNQNTTKPYKQNNTMTHEQFMLRAIELAKECATFDEVPVGAVVVKDGKIIAESGNRKERDNSAISHAEILALKKASEVVGNWWLEDCDVYVTLEPCAMCATAMIHSRIRNLYFGAYDEKTGAAGSKVNMFEKGLFNHDIEVVGGIMKEECGALLTAFFKNKRLQNKEKNK